MYIDDISYIKKETFEEKLKRLEDVPKLRYYEELGLSKEDMDRIDMFHLYHGLRFDSINKLESILQNKIILCGNKVSRTLKSYDGNTKYIYIDNYEDNCNMGEYISVMPYDYDNIEFDIFIRENIFFTLKGSIDAYKTLFLKYDDYCKLKESNIKTSNLYSYAREEYLVKDSISFDDVISIGIDSKKFIGDFNKTTDQIINLMKYYNIDIPLIDFDSNKEIYSSGKVKAR